MAREKRMKEEGAKGKSMGAHFRSPPSLYALYLYKGPWAGVFIR